LSKGGGHTAVRGPGRALLQKKEKACPKAACFSLSLSLSLSLCKINCSSFALLLTKQLLSMWLIEHKSCQFELKFILVSNQSIDWIERSLHKE
jgi:hypothetical protein